MDSGRHALLLVSLMMVGGCLLESVSGSGRVITESRNVSGFSTVTLSGSGKVVIDQNGTESLSVTADDNLLPLIESAVRDHTLVLGFRSMTNIRPSRDIVFKVTAKTLEGLDLSGSGTVDASGLATDRLAVAISGSGAVAANGTARGLDLSISGSGSYRGDHLTGTRASVHISGSGGAVMAVSEALDVNISGSGSVEYIGDPRVKKHISGSGSAYKR